MLGYITKAFGIKGGVSVKLINPESCAIAPGASVFLKKNQIERTLVVCDAMHGGRVFFADVNSREDAEQLIGFEIHMARKLLPKLDANEYYLSDLVGTHLVDDSGARIAEVIGLSSNNAQPILEVKTPDNEIALIPMVKPIVKNVDLIRGELLVDLPLGLLNINSN